ncbi:MAG: extracellular solute-binding protein [Candidatus Omnitrophota bacterium]|jgi:ABC-type glycerol-3-phosphate transport system substrate-binding protein
MKRGLILFVLGCFLLAGCGDNHAEKKGADGKTQITMWLIGSEGQALTIKELAEEFYKETGIKVKCDAISWGDAHSKYLTSIAGGVAPDIGTMGLTWGSEFGNLDSIVDLKKEYPGEIDSIKNTVFSGLWNSIEHKGKVYGIPFDMTEYVLYYRNDIIANPPKTWEELTTLLTDLNKQGKGMIFDWGSLSWIGYSPFLWQAGGDYYNQDLSAATVDSEAAVKAMDFFSGLYTRHNVPRSKIPLEQGMRTGDFPIAISGNWKIDDLRLLAPEIAGKWSIATLPKGPTGKSTAFIGGRIMSIFSQSKHKEEAWEFIKFLFRPEIQAKLYEASLTRQDTYLPPSMKGWSMLKMDPKFKDILVTQANDSKGPPAVASWDTSAKYVDEAIQKIILQKSDSRKELGIAKTQLERLLKK